MTITRLNQKSAAKYAAYQQHILKKLRAEESFTREPERMQPYLEFARISIICAKRGYMLNA